MNKAGIRKAAAVLVAASLAFTLACRPDGSNQSRTEAETPQASPAPTESAENAACTSENIDERITALNEDLTRRIGNSPFADQFREGKFSIKAEKRAKVIEDEQGTQNVDYIALTVKGSLHSKGRAGFESFNGLVKPYLGARCVTEVSYGGQIQDASKSSYQPAESTEFFYFKWGWCEEGKQVCADGECRERCTNKQ